MSANPVCYEPKEQPWLTSDSVISLKSASHLPIYLEAGEEKHVDMGKLDSLNFYVNNADTFRMRCLPTTVSDLIVKKFSINPNVRAVLVGESNGVHHVWVLLDRWTSTERKIVYAVQKDILQKIRGFNFDFYVVDIPEGADPSEMVSDIPLAFLRG